MHRFKKSEMKPLEIESQFQDLVNVLKFLNVLKDSDLIWLRQLFLLLYTYRYPLWTILVVLTVQLVLSLPLIGTLVSSLFKNARDIFIIYTKVFLTSVPTLALSVRSVLKQFLVALDRF